MSVWIERIVRIQEFKIYKWNGWAKLNWKANMCEVWINL